LKSRRTDLDWSLDFVGDGPLLGRAKNLVREYGLGSRIRFLGFRDDVAQVLSTAHVFVLASKWEGFPLTILEAMRAGLPVVASDVGGVSEAVVEGKTGYLVPREDVECMSMVLRTVVSSPGLRERLGGAGRERYEERFVFQRMFRKTVDVYEHVLAGVT